MKISKKHANFAAVILAAGVIAVAVYVGYEASRVEPQQPVGAPVTEPGSPNSATVPRNIMVAIAGKESAAQLDAEAVTETLQSSGSVQSALLEGQPPATVRLTLVAPLRFSRLNELLQSQGTEIVVERSPLHGMLLLHVTGMT